MDLLHQIRTGRAEKRRKPPFRPTLYTRVSGLVRRYGLDEAFLRVLAVADKLPREEELALKRKEPYELPLFSLSTEEEHSVTEAILTTVKNPFLQYATSPDEILVCKSLFQQNPSLQPETLARHHFETLLLAESARKQIDDLTERVHAIQEGRHLDEELRSQLPFLADRLAALRTFVKSVEDAGSS